MIGGLVRRVRDEIEHDARPVNHGPGVVVFDEYGEPESISGAAERWIGELVEDPPPSTPAQSTTVQAVAARARAIAPGTDPLELSARARVRTRSGSWLCCTARGSARTPAGAPP